MSFVQITEEDIRPIYIYIYIYIHNFAWGIWLWHLYLSNHIFWPILDHPRRQSAGGGGGKRSKIVYPSKNEPKSWKCAQRHNFWSQILYCYSFRTNHKFWPFWGHPRGEKGSKIDHFFKSNPYLPEAADLHKETISLQRFDNITDLGKI